MEKCSSRAILFMIGSFSVAAGIGEVLFCFTISQVLDAPSRLYICRLTSVGVI